MIYKTLLTKNTKKQ